MKVSASIELIWQLAGQEAIAAEFKEIEPEHFLEALLKFSELPVKEVERIAAGTNVARVLSAEAEAVRQELSSHSIDSTRMRRKLRVKLGKGNNPYAGGQMHRSQTSRDIFDAAAKLAADAGSRTLTAEYLLETLLSSPTPPMVKVLGGAIGPKIAKPTKTPLLDEYGNNLTQKVVECLAANLALPAICEQQVKCKALIQALAQEACKSVLLINDSDVVIGNFIVGLATEIAVSDYAARMKGKRIIDLTEIKPSEGDITRFLEIMEKLLLEAASAKDVILFLPPIETPDSEWTGLLKTRLAEGSLHCLCRVAPVTYNNWLKKDRAWKRIAQAMWIHEGKKCDIPTEL